MVDPKFWTGVVKITPAHDPNDFEAGRRHNLEIKQVIDHTGRLTEITGPYAGLKTMAARERVVADLKKKGLLVKVDPDYAHAVTVCYKCGRDLEPMITPNWFIKVKDLKTKVRETIEKDRVKFFPHRFKKHLLTWLDIMHDWPISRQIAWAIRIPAWYAVAKNPRLQVTFLDQKGQRVAGEIKTLLAKYSFTEIEKGLQTLVAPKDAAYEIAFAKPKGNYLQETDTFDTWFSSGQWPLLVLEKAELKTRFPTDVLGTLSDILKFWVSRMILFSLYLTNQVPFKDVYLWSMVADAKGIKMSKSKGNVVNPIALVEKYGADALRFSLLYGSPAGSKVILSDDKVRAMRNFANKIWNLGRFLQMSYQGTNPSDTVPKDLQAADQKILFELNQLIQKTTAALDGYRLNEAAELIYGFAWHTFADKYVEETKERTKHKDRAALYTLRQIYLNILKLLHPFMPFVTEQIWREISSLRQSPDQLLIKTAWPKP